MGKINLFTLALLINTLISNSVFSQDAITVLSNINGLVTYDLQLSSSDSHVFILYGDGTFGNNHNPVHSFAPDSIGYTTEAYVIKPYKPNLPPSSSTSTGSIGSGNNTINPTVNMSGDIDVLTSWAPSSGNRNYFIIAFKNSSSITPISGCVEFLYNNNDMTIDTSNIREYNNWVYNRTLSAGSFGSLGSFDRQIKWDFDNLAHNETRYIYVSGSVSLEVGNKLNYHAQYTTYCGTNPHSSSRNKSGSVLIRRYPHDPNFMLVDKTCLIQGPEQYLRYTVGFFNEGQGYAQNVYLNQQIPANWDATHIDILDYEYPLHMYIDNNMLFFDFINIYLPGTNQTFPQAYSYEDAFTSFTYGICTKPISSDICINTNIDIVFDDQPVFTTNDAMVCNFDGCTGFQFCDQSLRESQQEIYESHQDWQNPKTLDFEVYPNPFNEDINISIDFGNRMDEYFSINILDARGNIVRQLPRSKVPFEKFEKQFYLNNLPNGMYIILLKTDSATYSRKIVKQ